MLNARVLKPTEEELSRGTPLPVGTRGMGCLLHSAVSEHLDGDLEESQYLLVPGLCVDYWQAHCQSPTNHRGLFENHWFSETEGETGS